MQPIECKWAMENHLGRQVWFEGILLDVKENSTCVVLNRRGQIRIFTPHEVNVDYRRVFNDPSTIRINCQSETTS